MSIPQFVSKQWLRVRDLFVGGRVRKVFAVPRMEREGT